MLVGRVRNHTIVTDRPVDEGGRDRGGTSGELLLLAIGSCAVGNLRDHILRSNLPVIFNKADIFLETNNAPEDFGRVVVSAELYGAMTPEESQALIEAAGGGRVVRRLRTGSRVDIQIKMLPSESYRPAQVDNGKPLNINQT